MQRKRQVKKEQSPTASQPSKPEIVGIRPKKIVDGLDQDSRSTQAESRIIQAVAMLSESGSLPDTATARSHAIIAAAKQLTGTGISQTTLHKPKYLLLWHPDHYFPQGESIPKEPESTPKQVEPPSAQVESPSDQVESRPLEVESPSAQVESRPPEVEFTPPPVDAPRKALTKEDITRRKEIRIWWKKKLPEFSFGLTMPELAKRWGISSYKIGQRQTTPKFGKWSHKCDPNGIIWEYRPASQQNIPQFFPVGKAPQDEPDKPGRPKPGQPKAGRPKPGRPKPGKPKPKRPDLSDHPTSASAG